MDAGDTSKATQPKPRAKRPPYYILHVQDAVRTLSAVLHEVRQDPELLLNDPTLQEQTEIQLEALALAKALARGREYTPTVTRPAMLAPWELRALALEAWHALVRLGFKGKVNQAVKAWVRSLAVARTTNPLPDRLPPDSKAAHDWQRFKNNYREWRKPQWKGSGLEPTGDLHGAHEAARKKIVRLTLRPALAENAADSINLWKLRIHALERAIERRDRKACPRRAG